MLCRLILICASVLVATGCRPPTDNSVSPPSTAPVSIYQAQGVVQRTDPATREVLIAHDAIPGYMDAMTMTFTAAPGSDVQGLIPGDVITFSLHVGEKRSWIDEFRKTGERREVAATTPAQNAPGLAVGDILSECEFIDETGKPRRISEFRGQVLALTFFFTRCPLPDFCPLLSRRFAETQRLLATSASSRPWHLLSLSVDPDFDTPERLTAYAASYRQSSERWTFATGTASKVLPFAAACGVSIATNGGQIDHNLRTLVVDADGRVRRIFTGNEWTPQMLVEEIERAAGPPR